MIKNIRIEVPIEIHNKNNKWCSKDCQFYGIIDWNRNKFSYCHLYEQILHPPFFGSNNVIKRCKQCFKNSYLKDNTNFVIVKREVIVNSNKCSKDCSYTNENNNCCCFNYNNTNNKAECLNYIIDDKKIEDINVNKLDDSICSNDCKYKYFNINNPEIFNCSLFKIELGKKWVGKWFNKRCEGCLKYKND